MTFGYDFSDTEELGDFVTLTPGRYIFALAAIEKGESDAGNPKAVVTLRVVAGNPAYIDGVIRQHWPVTGKGAFRFRAMMKAFGIKFTDKGKVNLAKYIDKEFGARVSLTQGDRRNDAGEIVYFHELNAILPASQYVDVRDGEYEDPEDEEVEDDEEVEEEETEEEEDSEDEGDEEEDEDEEGDEITLEDLDDMDLAALKELAAEWEVSTKPAKGKTRITAAEMRKRLAAEFPDDEEEEEDEDEEDEDEEGLSPEDLDGLNLAQLKEIASENGVKLPRPAKGKTLTAARVRTVLKEALFSDEESDDEEEPF